MRDEKEGLLFKMLAEKSLYETGMEFGFDKRLKNSQGVKNAVYRIYVQVKSNPEKYLITPEVVDLVSGVVSSRKVAERTNVTLREQNDSVQNTDLKELVTSARDKSMRLIHKKLDQISSNKKALDSVNLVQLTTAFGTIFDKAQIISGEATENIAVLSKIKSDMTPEESMNMILKMREINQQDKDRVTKRK